MLALSVKLLVAVRLIQTGCDNFSSISQVQFCFIGSSSFYIFLPIYSLFNTVTRYIRYIQPYQYHSRKLLYVKYQERSEFSEIVDVCDITIPALVLGVSAGSIKNKRLFNFNLSGGNTNSIGGSASGSAGVGVLTFALFGCSTNFYIYNIAIPRIVAGGNPWYSQSFSLP